jgi:hypothetical protein
MTVLYGHFNSVNNFTSLKTIMPLFKNMFSKTPLAAAAALGLAMTLNACA